MSLEASQSSSTESSSSSSSSSSSTPVDTASIAASVIADAEGGSSTESQSVDTTEQKVDAGDTTQAAAQATEVDPDDFDAVQAEVIDSLGRKRTNSIPHPRVKKMIAKAVERERAKWDTEALTPVRTELDQHKSRLTEIEALEQIMANEPDRFVQMLAMANPAYQKFAAVLNAGGTVAQAAAAASTVDTASEFTEPMPEPDYDLGDGKKTYSVDGLRKRDEWMERRLAHKLTRDLDSRFGERLKPFEQERKEKEQRERAEKVKEGAREAIARQLEKAKKWPGFADNAEEIRQVFVASTDPDFTIHDAYLQVYGPKMAADRTKMREELLSEINGQARSTSAGSTAAAAKPSGGPKSTADVAREVMRELGGA